MAGPGASGPDQPVPRESNGYDNLEPGDSVADGKGLELPNDLKVVAKRRAVAQNESQTDADDKTVELPAWERVGQIPEIMVMIFGFIGPCPAEHTFKDGTGPINSALLCTCGVWRSTWARLSAVNRLAFSILAPRIWAHLGYGSRFWSDDGKINSILATLGGSLDGADARNKRRELYRQSVVAVRLGPNNDPSLNADNACSRAGLGRFAALLRLFPELRRLEIGHSDRWSSQLKDRVISDAAQQLTALTSAVLDVTRIPHMQGVQRALNSWIGHGLKSVEIVGQQRVEEPPWLPQRQFATRVVELLPQGKVKELVGEHAACLLSDSFRMVVCNLDSVESKTASEEAQGEDKPEEAGCAPDLEIYVAQDGKGPLVRQGEVVETSETSFRPVELSGPKRKTPGILGLLM